MARVFVAVWPSASVIEALSAIERPVIDGVRWTRPETWHVTLRFLGETDPLEVSTRLRSLSHPEVDAVLRTAIGRLGRSALVAPVTGLDTLAGAVDQTLGASPRAFVGHLTLARLKRRAACDPARILTSGLARPITWRVDRIAVVVSDLRSDAAHYTTVAEVGLG